MSYKFRNTGVAIMLAVMLALSLAGPVLAKHKNFAQRHPTMTAAAAGIGTTLYLKHEAKLKRERGEKLSFAERHPYLSGAGVAVVTHHLIKKSEPQ